MSEGQTPLRGGSKSKKEKGKSKKEKGKTKKEKGKGKKKKSSLGSVIVLGILVVFFAAGLLYYTDGISAADPKDQAEIYVTINPGSDGKTVLTQLEQSGLVKSKICAKVFLRLFSPEKIQANTYVFSKTLSLMEMYKAMEQGDPAYLQREKITVIEGATIPQVAKIVADRFQITPEEVIEKWRDKEYLSSLIEGYWFLSEDILNQDLLHPLEGYFYPETYFASGEALTIEDITAVMLNQMEQELTPFKEEINSKLNMSPHEFLSFASVVEAEALFPEDRAKIAGVFMNRIKKKMPMQSCITVLYALEVERKRPKITTEETKIDSKYNTYKNKGLPVGPVCTVQKATMESCLNYEKSEYLYFFATEEGKTIYSKTYEEHKKVIKENKWY